MSLSVPGMGRRPGARRRALRGDGFFPYALLLPSIVVLMILVVLPLVYAFDLSLHKATVVVVGGQGQVRMQWTGLDNYLYFLADPRFWASVRTTAYFTVVSLVVELIFGMLIALVLSQEFWGRNVIRALIILPWAVPTVVNARLWGWIYNGESFGALNALLQQLHLLRENVVWLQTTPILTGVPVLGPFFQWAGASLALNMIVIGDTWHVLPVVTLLLLAGLQTIPAEFYEAARIDGAGRWQQFWAITVPRLRPVILVILVYRTMELFRVFDIIYILLGYAINVLSIATFQQAFVFGLMGRGAALAFLIGLLILTIAIVYIRLFRAEEVEY